MWIRPQSGHYKCFGTCAEVKTVEFPPVGVWCLKGLAVVDATVEEEEAMEVEVSCSPFYCGWLPELDLPVPWSPAFRQEEVKFWGKMAGKIVKFQLAFKGKPSNDCGCAT